MAVVKEMTPFRQEFKVDALQGAGAPAVQTLPAFENPRAAMLKFYNHEYLTGRKSDSTDLSRTSLMKRLHQTTAHFKKGDTVINVASGPQALERQYLSSYGKPDFTFITVDNANIPPERFLAGNSLKVKHVRADGTTLPFADSSVSALICNMGIEYMPEIAIDEIHRVVKNGGNVHLNIWTKKDSWEGFELKNGYASNIKRTPTARRQKEFWQRFLNSDVSPLIGQDKNTVRDIFRIHGFTVKNIKEVKDSETSWLEVDLIRRKTWKPSSGNGEAKLGQGTRQWVRGTEFEIFQRKQGIKAIDRERQDTKGFYEKGLLSHEEYVIFDSSLLKQRREVSSQQKSARAEIHPYKTISAG